MAVWTAPANAVNPTVMSEELLINVTPQETRVAFVENGILQEVHIERARKRGLVGNVYKGRVCRVLPGMQAAFVEMGLERTAFLHASDVMSGNGDTGDGDDEEGARPAPENITALLREGQDVLVQVVKDPLGTKGARLTTHISIPSRFLVFMPATSHIGVSQKIEEEAERERLKAAIRQATEDFAPGGYIVRTVAEGTSEEALHADMRFLHKLWSAIQERSSSEPVGSLVHEDMPLVMRTMRDLVGTEIEKVRIDSRETFQKVHKFASKFIPELADSI